MVYPKNFLYGFSKWAQKFKNYSEMFRLTTLLYLILKCYKVYILNFSPYCLKFINMFTKFNLNILNFNFYKNCK